MNIKETLQYISNCDLYIGNDTGWAHISVALKVKALTIFCDSPVAAYGSYSSKMITVEPEGEMKGTLLMILLEKIKFHLKKFIISQLKCLTKISFNYFIYSLINKLT